MRTNFAMTTCTSNRALSVFARPRQLIGGTAVTLVLAMTLLSPVIANAADLPGCASGFTAVSETKSELTCIRTEKADSEADADNKSKLIETNKGCGGKVTEQRASVADGLDGGWLVTMLFSCADGD